MQVNLLTLNSPWRRGLDKKVRRGNCADKYILIELNDLIVFGYDLSATRDGLKC